MAGVKGRCGSGNGGYRKQCCRNQRLCCTACTDTHIHTYGRTYAHMIGVCMIQVCAMSCDTFKFDAPHCGCVCCC